MTERRRASRPPIIFAHRGGGAHAPENTIEAFDSALRMGADGLESDVWITRDGVPVLVHDGHLGGRLRRRPIAALRRDELPAHIPTLAELYATCGHEFQLALDLRGEAALDPVLQTAERAAPEAVLRLWLCSGSLAELADWSRTAGAARLVLSAERWPGRANQTDAVTASARGAGVAAINLRSRAWSAGLVQACHDAALRAFAWGVGTLEEARSLVALDVDGLMGDDLRALGPARTRPGRPTA